jgi:hypothetical protein
MQEAVVKDLSKEEVERALAAKLKEVSGKWVVLRWITLVAASEWYRGFCSEVWAEGAGEPEGTEVLVERGSSVLKDSVQRYIQRYVEWYVKRSNAERDELLREHERMSEEMRILREAEERHREEMNSVERERDEEDERETTERE